MRIIRRAMEEDWPAIWQLFQEVIAAGDVFAYDESTSESVARALWATRPAIAYVAEDDNGILVGTYFVRPNQPGRGSHVANAGYIVRPSARNSGLGFQLCQHSIDVARQQQYRAMQFNFVVCTNLGALSVWKKCGFRVVGHIPNAFRHRSNGDVDVLILWRSLEELVVT